ncbi:hypothetical protein JR316_0002810 [Psilocybe cubensis]|uniref:Uncharacterized protein n=1 Tax=Psilocybe cubensis TaxID=181762 RepID=A0ACB8HDL7_PSICU|nr:hypothetical protein JR316_0002810 [Psilocybe cubensis]KAH9485893.1 hypothetical protein JR316_0002810 [Psilocybe cubensis]
MLPDVRLGVKMLGKEAVNHVYRGHRLPISKSNELIGLDSIFGQRKISFMTQIVSPLLPRIHALSQIVLAQEDMKAFLSIPAQSIAHVRTVNVINEVYFFRTPYRSLLVRTRPTAHQQSQKPANACVEMWTNWGPSQTQSAVCLRVFNDRHLLNVNLNLGNLSIITIVDYPMEWHHVFVHICLPCAPRLVEATLSIRFPRIAGIQSKENIKHAPKFKRRACFSVLRKLALRLYDPSQNPKFLEYIDAPVLDSLVVNASETYMPLQRWDIQAYAKFLRKAWATLTALELVETLSPGVMFMGRILDESEAHGMRQDGADLDTLFSAIPKVLHLKLPFTIPIHKDVFWRLGRREYISRMTGMRITCPSRDVPAMCRALKMRESYFRGSYFEPKSNKGPRGDLAPEVVCTVFLLTSYPEDDEGWMDNGVEKDASGDQNEDRRVIWRQQLEAQIAEILSGTGVRMSVAYLPYGRSSRKAWRQSMDGGKKEIRGTVVA